MLQCLCHSALMAEWSGFLVKGLSSSFLSNSHFWLSQQLCHSLSLLGLFPEVMYLQTGLSPYRDRNSFLSCLLQQSYQPEVHSVFLWTSLVPARYTLLALLLPQWPKNGQLCASSSNTVRLYGCITWLYAKPHVYSVLLLKFGISNYSAPWPLNPVYTDC